jgi:hypothetical protein
VTLPLNSTPKRICLGFGPHEGKCTNAAGPRSPYWCDRCEDLRREHITKQLYACVKSVTGARGERKEVKP